jgi:hypothetical protein
MERTQEYLLLRTVLNERRRRAVPVPIDGRPAGSSKQLTQEQEQKIQQLIQDRTPDQLKMVNTQWTCQVVG